jgi:hypothetical protein
MRVLHSIVAVTLAASSAAAQTTSDIIMLERIEAEGTERTQVDQLFGTLVDHFGARLTASPTYVRASEWARDRFSDWGLSDARLEPFDFESGWSLEKFTVEMMSPHYVPLMGVPLAWAPSTRGEITGPLVYLGDKSPDEIVAMAARVRGAIVLQDPPQSLYFRRDRVQPTSVAGASRSGSPFMPANREEATRRGALATELWKMEPAIVLSPSFGEHGTIFVGGGPPLIQALPDGDTLKLNTVPGAILAAEHYNMLVRMVGAGEPVELRVETRGTFHDQGGLAYNVLADLPGTDPELRNEVVMIGAHLDSWHGGVGATDNADAVAAAMEAMRILREVDARPRRTIRIALWGAEEVGMVGSRTYVESLTPEELENISVYLNDDPGTGPTYGFYMEENAEAKAIFDRWLAVLGDVGVRRNVFEGIGGTDHVAFDASNVPAFTAIKDYTDYDTRTHHTNADLAERVRRVDLVQSAVVLASMAWLAASADEKVPRRPAGPSPTVGRWGAIVGDPTNLDPVVGARVSLEGTDHTGTTNERGELVLDGLAGGRFTIVIEHPEYAPYRFENALVRAGRLTFTNYWLQPAPTR